jgi:hypothetical protein
VFSYEGKAYNIKFRFGVVAFQDPPLCGSTFLVLFPSQLRRISVKKVVFNIYQYKKLPLFAKVLRNFTTGLQEDLVHEKKITRIKSCAANILCCMRLDLFPE